MTTVTRKTCCARCGAILKPGKPMVYRREPRESLCVTCADIAGIKYLISLKAEAELRKPKAA